MLIFDVVALLETPKGREILDTELRSVLGDVKIRKVGPV